MPVTRQRPLLIVGAGGFAEVAAEYFEMDGNRRVVAFAVEPAFLNKTQCRGRPVVSIDQMVVRFPPEEHDFFAAITYQDMNRQRRRLLNAVTDLGYRPVNYISPHAFVAASASVGSHVFIMENNVVQPFVHIGDNVVLWSGNHVGHHSRVSADCFVSSHVVISGNVEIGRGCFLGVNSTVADGLRLGSECWLGPGVCVTENLPDGGMCREKGVVPSRASTWRFFRIAAPDNRDGDCDP